MQSIIRFSLKQRIFFNLVFILLTVSGFFAVFTLPAERFPDFNLAVVSITTDFPGASPAEVESLVTRKIEEAIEDIEDIDWVSASSQAERSLIRLKFVDNSDYLYLYNEIRLKIQNIIEELPERADPPIIDNITVGDLLPAIVVNVTGEHGNRALSLIAEQIKAQLLNVSGVKNVIISGDFTREFHIFLDPQKLKYFGISFNEVVGALNDANVSVAAGHFKDKLSEYLVKVDERFDSRDKVVKTILRRDGDGGYIRLEDLIVEAEIGYRKPIVLSSVNGNPAVSLRVIKHSTGNALKIKKEVTGLLDRLKPLAKKENVKLVLTQDSTVKIKEGLTTLGWNLFVGMLLVSTITWYFMGIRNAGLVTIGIPFSFLVTMLTMMLTGYSFNELTLFAFVLVTGIIVDDAIVATENIHRYIQAGSQVHQAIVDGLSEVALPIISSTFTTIAAFLPLLIMTGTAGEFFAQIPVVVSFALFASLIESVFILPIHYLDFGPTRTKVVSRRLAEDNFIVSFFRGLTEKTLKWTLKYRVLSIFSVIVLFFVSIFILVVSLSGVIPLVRTQFFPDDYAIYFVDIKGSPNTSIEQVDALAKEISQFIIEEEPGMADSATGAAGTYFTDDHEYVFSKNFGMVMVSLPEKDKQSVPDPMEHLATMRKRIKENFEKDGFTLRVHPMKEGPPTGKAINIKVLGSNIDMVKGLADEITDVLLSRKDIAPYIVELEDNKGVVEKALHFKIRHSKVKEYNLSSSDVASLAGSVLDGQYIGKYRASDEEIDLKLFIEQSMLNQPSDVLDIPVVEDSMSPVLLGDVTQLQLIEEPSELYRYQGQRAVSIKSDIKTGAPISSAYVVNEINQYFEGIQHKYPGTTLLFSGEHDNTKRSYKSLVFAFVIAVMIIYTILAAQFQSYIQPVIILFAVLFAIIGIVFGKFITQSLFTVNSFIAVIGVIGVVVNDALVLIDFLNKAYRSGMTRLQSINKAVSLRLRPIILTTLTTILGLFPMAVGIPSYSVVWGPMASTFVTGLGVASFLTLCVVPVVWDLIQERQEKH